MSIKCKLNTILYNRPESSTNKVLKDRYKLGSRTHLIRLKNEDIIALFVGYDEDEDDEESRKKSYTSVDAVLFYSQMDNTDESGLKSLKEKSSDLRKYLLDNEIKGVKFVLIQSGKAWHSCNQLQKEIKAEMDDIIYFESPLNLDEVLRDLTYSILKMKRGLLGGCSLYYSDVYIDSLEEVDEKAYFFATLSRLNLQHITVLQQLSKNGGGENAYKYKTKIDNIRAESGKLLEKYLAKVLAQIEEAEKAEDKSEIEKKLRKAINNKSLRKLERQMDKFWSSCGQSYLYHHTDNLADKSAVKVLNVFTTVKHLLIELCSFEQ